MHSAKFVWATPDGEALIAKMARVSNPGNENNPNITGLIRYLIKHNHWSPFEMASLCLEIDTTRAIAPQVLRHRSFSFQEFSQRYAESLAAPLPHLRSQDDKNRQNSIDDLPDTVIQHYEAEMAELRDAAFLLYRNMLADGVAKECARNVLPAGLTATRMYMTGTVRSWLHYCDLRCANGTQAEHMAIANSAKEILQQHFPHTCEAMWVDSTSETVS